MHHYYPCSRTRSNPVAPLLSTHSIWLIHSPIASFIHSSSPYSFAQCQCVGLESADTSLVRVAADQSHVFSGCYLARQRVPRSTLSSYFHWSLVAGEEFISCTGVHSLVACMYFIIASVLDDESGSFSKGWLLIVTQELHPCLHYNQLPWPSLWILNCTWIGGVGAYEHTFDSPPSPHPLPHEMFSSCPSAPYLIQRKFTTFSMIYCPGLFTKNS